MFHLKSQIPKERSQIPPLRLNWKRFCTHLHSSYLKKGHQVRLIEAPLWQSTEATVSNISKESDIIYIPQNEAQLAARFPCPLLHANGYT